MLRILFLALTLFGTQALAAPSSNVLLRPIELDTGSGTLYGSLVLPKSDKPVPVVLIIAGSGPTDRDGNNTIGGRNDSLKKLAWRLAQNNIASVRFDKRGIAQSQPAAPDERTLNLDQYVTDAVAWGNLLKADPRFADVFVLGHSEGGLVSILAAQDSPDVCGLVLLAAPGRPLQQVLREQLAANPANVVILPQVDRIIATLEAGQAPDLTGVHPGVAALFNPALNTFFISLFSHDPAAELARYAGPALVVQGETDIQVSLADAERLAQARGLEPVIIPGMNHVLRDAPADRAANAATYKLADAPLSAGLAEAIAGFVTGR